MTQVGYRGDSRCCKRYGTVLTYTCQAKRRFLVEFILSLPCFFFLFQYIPFDPMSTRLVSHRFISIFRSHRCDMQVSPNRTEAPNCGSFTTDNNLSFLSQAARAARSYTKTNKQQETQSICIKHLQLCPPGSWPVHVADKRTVVQKHSVWNSGELYCT
jgi:hypothetical protein